MLVTEALLRGSDGPGRRKDGSLETRVERILRSPVAVEIGLEARVRSVGAAGRDALVEELAARRGLVVGGFVRGG